MKPLDTQTGPDTLPEIETMLHGGFYIMDITGRPGCITADGRYHFELEKSGDTYSVKEWSIEPIIIWEGSNLDLEIEGRQLWKWAAWIKWTNDDETNFVPRQFQKKLESLADVPPFFDEIQSLRATEWYKAEIERIISTM